MMRRTAMLLLAVFGFTAFALAQTQTVTGTVTDKKGDPLQGITVTIKNTKTGTSTDAKGSYSLNVSNNAVLVFTGAGITRREFSVSGKSVVDVDLETTTSNLNEVVVVGYGTRRIKDLTGSVASIGEKDFNKGVISSPEQLIQGRTPGVNITPASGEPGAGVSITIRGTSSIRSSNNPLFVVDGVPLDGGGTSGGLDNGAGMSSAKNPLTFLNPNDIENITILKDASASAIYGSRGANGVVLITTKKGRGNQGFLFSATSSVSNAAKKYNLLSAQDFVTGVKKAGGDPTAIDKGASTDWQDQIFRTGIAQNYNLSYGGSKGKTVYRISGGYNKQAGIIKNSDLERLTGRVNISQKLLDDKISLDLAFTASNVKNQYAPITDNAGFQGSLIGAAIIFNPTYPVYAADGSFYDPQDGNRNPAAMLAYISDHDNIKRYMGSISASWQIVKGLTYKVNLGIDNSSSERNTFLDPRLKGYTGNYALRGLTPDNEVSKGDNHNGRGIRQNYDLKSLLLEHTVTYDLQAGKSSFNILGGFAYQKFLNYQRNDFRWGVKTPGTLEKNLDYFQNRFPIFGDSSKNELQSYFGRVNYNYNDKYFLTATLRVDGSSKFGSGNKYGYFPAFAAKWKVLNENFIGNGFKDIFADLSLRLNYGKTGNQEFPSYTSLAISQRNFNGGNNTLQAANPNIKWEEATTKGIGLDYSLIKGRLKGSIDYFDKETKNLIFLNEYAQPAAVSKRWINLPGIVTNKGFEIGLDVQAVKSRSGSFGWDIAYNMTFLKNNIKDFGANVVNTGNIDGQGLSGAYAQTIINGHPLFTFKMPVFLRYDGNGDAVYTNGSADQILGSALPKFTAGLTNNFTVGRWNASFFINVVTGFYVYNNTANALFLKGSLKTAHNVDYATFNSDEDPINPGSVSSRFLEKGDFGRLSNASIGYNFYIKNKGVIKSLNVSVSGQNLILVTNYTGLDPEVNTNKARDGVPSRGIDYTPYPSARTFTLGLNIGF